MSEVQSTSASTPVKPFKVDTSRGAHDGTVSMQWIARPHDQRFLNLNLLEQFKRQFYQGSWETRASTRQVEMIGPKQVTRETLHQLTVGVVDKSQDVQRVHEVAPSHYSFGQLCGLAKAPAPYLRELPSPLVVDQLNWRLRHAREVEQIKFYGNDELLHAATGPEYGRIPDYEVVQAVQQVAGDGLGGHRWKIPGMMNWSNMTYDPEHPVTIDTTTLYASDRDLFIFLVDDRNPIEIGKLPDGSPDYVFRGFYVQNSEVGARSLKICVFYLRGVCMNRNLWGVEGMEDITIRHTRAAPDRWLQEAQPALKSFAEGSSMKLIEGVRKAKEAKLADDQDDALAFLQARDFSRERAKAILELGEKEEQRPVRTAWDFAQAITAYARNVPYTDQRLQVEMEAKKILDKVA